MNTSDQGQNPQQPYYNPPPVVQQTVIMMGQDRKSVAAAFLLAFFFGPLGLFYSSIVGGIVMLIIDLPVAIFTLGFGLIFTNIICVIWAMVAVNNHNKKLGSPQQFHQVQQSAPPAGFHSFGTPPPPPPPVQQPSAPPPPAAEYKSTPPVQEFRSFGAPAPPPPASGTPGSPSLNAFSEWVTQNTKGLLIGAGSIVGLVLLIVVVKFLLSLDFNKKDSPTAAAEPVSTTQKNEPPAPIPQESTTSLPTQPSAEPAQPVSTSNSSSEPEVEKDSGFGFVKTQKGSPLNMRDKPSMEGTEVIKSIPNGSFIHVLGHTKNPDQVNGESGRWLKISYLGTEGWVWEKFIERSK